MLMLLPPAPSQLVEWASNRQVWASEADAVVHRYKHSCKQVHFHSFTSIRRLFALLLPWLHCLFFKRFSGRLCILFILRKAGCTTLWRALLMLHGGALKQCSAIIISLMLGNAWVIQVCVSQLHQDELAAIMLTVQDQMWVSHGRSLLCELLPDEQFKHLNSLHCPMPDV